MFTALPVYVDDFILTDTFISNIQSIKLLLDDKFKIKDYHTKVTCLLNGNTFLTVKPLLHSFAKDYHKPDSNIKPYNDHSAYRRLVGRLLYLTTTRPNICFVVQFLSQHMVNPFQSHCNAAIRLLRYLKGAPVLGLFFPASYTLHLKAFSDSDWATCPFSRKYITSFCIFLGDSLVTWRSKKHAIVSRSSLDTQFT